MACGSMYYARKNEAVMPKQQDISDLVQSMFAGDIISLARLISIVEAGRPEATGMMELVRARMRKTYCIGITGLAGAGKSTLVDRLAKVIRNKNLTVGIVAIDPSSAFTGGAVLGDRIRMQQHFLDDGVFIRSMATRGSCGGLSKAVGDTVDLMAASGRDVVIVETTGVGQTEVDITSVADRVVVVMVPGYGDSIQLMKAGLIEIADIVAINKADREGADGLAADITDSLMLSRAAKKPPVLMIQAANNSGVEELYQELEKLRTC
jgi:LAO/AO transport system kinase